MNKTMWRSMLSAVFLTFAMITGFSFPMLATASYFTATPQVSMTEDAVATKSLAAKETTCNNTSMTTDILACGASSSGGDLNTIRSAFTGELSSMLDILDSYEIAGPFKYVAPPVARSSWHLEYG